MNNFNQNSLQWLQKPINVKLHLVYRLIRVCNPIIARPIIYLHTPTVFAAIFPRSAATARFLSIDERMKVREREREREEGKKQILKRRKSNEFPCRGKSIKGKTCYQSKI